MARAASVRWFAHGDVRLPWTDLGGADTPVVVALPGLTDGLMPLSEPRTRAVVAALPHGTVPTRILLVSHRHPVGAGTTTLDLADDVATFVREVVGHPVAVTGHSMGGMVAQWLAARHPDLVTHLALTATLARPDARFREVLGRWDRFVRAGDWRAFYADANATSYAGSELLRRRLLLRLTRAAAVPHLAERHHRLTEACLAHDSRPVLADIACPTLVLAGSEDPVVGLARSRELADCIAGAQLAVLPGLRHGFPEQAPRRTYDAIARLLDVPGTGRETA